MCSYTNGTSCITHENFWQTMQLLQLPAASYTLMPLHCVSVQCCGRLCRSSLTCTTASNMPLIPAITLCFADRCCSLLAPAGVIAPREERDKTFRLTAQLDQECENTVVLDDRVPHVQEDTRAWKEAAQAALSVVSGCAALMALHQLHLAITMCAFWCVRAMTSGANVRRDQVC